MKLLDNNWINLYELLGVDTDADEQTLQESLCAYEARGKSNLHKKFVAQYRRILLDPDCRDRYNQVLARHQAGDPTALEFQAFLSVVHNDDLRRHLKPAAEAHPTARASLFVTAHLRRRPATASPLQPDFSPQYFITADLRRQFTDAPVSEHYLSPSALLSHSPALSRTSINLLTGIVATLLISYIQSGTQVLPGL